MLDAGPPVDAAVRNALFRSRADHPCAVPTRRRALKSARTFPHQRGTYAARSKRGDLRLSNRTKYTYDVAHRLTQISDSVDDSINYTLDPMGNRTLEQVRDPGGNLSRQISRAYDALNRLQTVTGALQ